MTAKCQRRSHARQKGYGQTFLLEIYIPHLMRENRREKFDALLERFKVDVENMRGIVQKVNDV